MNANAEIPAFRSLTQEEIDAVVGGSATTRATTWIDPEPQPWIEPDPQPVRQR